MPLRGKKPEPANKRLKLFLYGEAGVGKTFTCVNFPKTYFIDCERGAQNDQYSKLLVERGGVYFGTNDYEEAIKEVRALSSEQHEYQTLVIDPITTLYNRLVDEEMAGGTDYGAHYGRASAKLKRLLSLATNLDMTVVLTAHSKTKYEDVVGATGKKRREAEGSTFDGMRGLDYIFDLVLEVTKRRDKKRFARVIKTRVEEFKDGDMFEYSYDAIADKYGREFIERNAIPVPIASPEQIARLRDLLSLRVDGENLEKKWNKRANVENIEDMPETIATKCIEFLTPKESND